MSGHNTANGRAQHAPRSKGSVPTTMPSQSTSNLGGDYSTNPNPASQETPQRSSKSTTNDQPRWKKWLLYQNLGGDYSTNPNPASQEPPPTSSDRTTNHKATPKPSWMMFVTNPEQEIPSQPMSNPSDQQSGITPRSKDEEDYIDTTTTTTTGATFDPDAS